MQIQKLFQKKVRKFSTLSSPFKSSTFQIDEQGHNLRHVKRSEGIRYVFIILLTYAKEADDFKK